MSQAEGARQSVTYRASSASRRARPGSGSSAGSRAPAGPSPRPGTSRGSDGGRRSCPPPSTPTTSTIDASDWPLPADTERHRRWAASRMSASPCYKRWWYPRDYRVILGVARFIDASIYRDTFPAIRIAILFFTIAIFIFEFFLNFCLNFLFFPQWFSFGQKRDIIISTCDFCKVIPQIHSYFLYWIDWLCLLLIILF